MAMIKIARPPTNIKRPPSHSVKAIAIGAPVKFHEVVLTTSISTILICRIKPDMIREKAKRTNNISFMELTTLLRKRSL